MGPSALCCTNRKDISLAGTAPGPPYPVHRTALHYTTTPHYTVICTALCEEYCDKTYRPTLSYAANTTLPRATYICAIPLRYLDALAGIVASIGDQQQRQPIHRQALGIVRTVGRQPLSAGGKGFVSAGSCQEGRAPWVSRERRAPSTEGAVAPARGAIVLAPPRRRGTRARSS